MAAYVQAYAKHDAQALADLWSPEAVYTNRLTGEEVVGRAAIVEQFTALFTEQPELKLDVEPESIQLLSPNAADRALKGIRRRRELCNSDDSPGSSLEVSPIE